MAKDIQLYDATYGTKYYPRTHSKLVLNENGSTVDEALVTLDSSLDSLESRVVTLEEAGIGGERIEALEEKVTVIEGEIDDLQTDVSKNTASIKTINNGNVTRDSQLANHESRITGLEEKSFEITDGSIITSMIANGAITEDKLAADSITSSKIKDGSITKDKLAEDSVTSSKIKDGEVIWNKLSVPVQMMIENGQIIELTQAEYDALTEYEVGTIYAIIDGTSEYYKKTEVDALISGISSSYIDTKISELETSLNAKITSLQIEVTSLKNRVTELEGSSGTGPMPDDGAGDL